MKLMINEQVNVGDLVYIPSEVLLTNYRVFVKTEKPVNVVCLGKKSAEVKVFYNGSAWWVNKSKVYSIKEENGN